MMMDFGSFAGMSAGVGPTIGAVPMIPKLTRGIMRRNVDYTSGVITYLEVSCSRIVANLLHLMPTTWKVRCVTREQQLLSML